MLRTLATLAVLALACSPVLAQAPGSFGRPPGPGTPGYRPPVSPYLNLARGGVPGINYYGLVRPQVQGNQALQEIERQLNPTAQSPMVPGVVVDTLPGGPGEVPGVAPSAGTVVVAPGFLTHSRYYQNVRPPSGAQVPGGGAAGAGAGALQPQRGR